MKHLRIFLLFLLLAVLFSGCADTVQDPYDYTYDDRRITVCPEDGTIEDGQDIYRYTRETDGSRIWYVITYPNGATFSWTQEDGLGAGNWSDDYNESRYLSGNILISALQEGEPQEKVGSPIAGILLMALGVWGVLSPETLFYLSKGWMFKDAEPSDACVILTRVGGVVTALAGLILCFV